MFRLTRVINRLCSETLNVINNYVHCGIPKRVVGSRPSPVEVKATSGQKAIHHHTRTSSLQSKKLTCKKQQDIQQQKEHRAILKYRDSVKNTQPQHLQVIIIC